MWQIPWGRAAVGSVLLALAFGWPTGAAFLGGAVAVVGYQWLRPEIAVREMPNFDSEAEALSYWRFTHNRWIPLPHGSIRDWRWRVRSDGTSR